MCHQRSKQDKLQSTQIFMNESDSLCQWVRYYIGRFLPLCGEEKIISLLIWFLFLFSGNNVYFSFQLSYLRFLPIFLLKCLHCYIFIGIISWEYQTSISYQKLHSGVGGSSNILSLWFSSYFWTNKSLTVLCSKTL